MEGKNAIPSEREITRVTTRRTSDNKIKKPLLSRHQESMAEYFFSTHETNLWTGFSFFSVIFSLMKSFIKNGTKIIATIKEDESA